MTSLWNKGNSSSDHNTTRIERNPHITTTDHHVDHCPDWCTLAGRTAHMELQPEDNHAGPKFGIVCIEGVNRPDGTVEATAATQDVACLDPAGLRRSCG